MKILKLKRSFSQRKILSLSFICLFAIQILGQSSINTTQLLAKIIEQNKSFIPYSENLDFLEQQKQGLPILSEISLRTESDELEYEKQRYQARFKFNTEKERSSNRKIIESKKGQYQSRQDAFLLDQLEEMNSYIVNYYFIQKEIKCQEEELLILEDKKSIYQKLMEQGANFDVERWLKNEENILETNSKLIKNLSLKGDIERRVQLFRNGEVKGVFEDWLSVKGLRVFLMDSIINESLHPDYLINRAKEEQAKAEYQLEKGEANKWLDFIQFEYKGNEKLPYNKEVSLGAGIRIPFRAFNRVKVNEAFLEVLESEYDTRMDSKKYNERLANSFADLKRLFVEYDLFQNYIKKQNIQETYDAYLKNTLISPLLLLNIKQILISQKKTNASIEKEIFQEYIKLLADSGTLLRRPLKNYLTEEFLIISKLHPTD